MLLKFLFTKIHPFCAGLSVLIGKFNWQIFEQMEWFCITRREIKCVPEATVYNNRLTVSVSALIFQLKCHWIWCECLVPCDETCSLPYTSVSRSWPRDGGSFQSRQTTWVSQSTASQCTLANNSILTGVQYIFMQKFCLDIGHYVTNVSKSWCANVVLQTLHSL